MTMNKKSFLTALLLLAAGLQTASAQLVTIVKKTGDTETIRLLEVESIIFSEYSILGGHEYVDLELPSGTLWARTNVGANSPEDYGEFFAWGETQPKDNYSWSNYQHAIVDDSNFWLTKYCNNYTIGYHNYWDTFTDLQYGDDAATANWDNEWQMPSNEQWMELINSENTSAAWVTQDGQQGLLVTSNRNGKSIFLPGAGYYKDAQHDAASASTGYHAIYWSRSLYMQGCEQGCSFYGGQTGFDVYRADRYWGLSVRPVRKFLVNEIVLDKTQLSLDADRSQTAQLTATVLPSNASNKEVTWECSNYYVASVDQTGKVKTVNPGNCVITCRATDGSGVKAECKVIVGGTSGGGDIWD